jgi:hypothetical protein
VSFDVLQLVAHDAPLQVKPAQVIVVPLGQVPPLQLDADTTVPLVQLCAEHCVVGYEHAVCDAVEQVPWHMPEPEQAARLPCGCPDVTAEHVPNDPETSQAWHCPEHAELQQ